MNRIDVHESDEDNLVTATFELPGMKKTDFSVELHGNRLVVSGEAKIPKQKEESYTVKERRGGKFSRNLTVPIGTELEDITASMADGLLTITYPKSSEEHDSKVIAIA